MNTKTILTCLLVGSAILMPASIPNTQVAHAQEAQQVSNSTLANVAMPTGTLLVSPDIVPPQVSDALELMIKAGGPNVRRGQTEVLAWAGPDYKKSRVPQLKAQISAKLKAAGWNYEEGAPIPGAAAFTTISIMRTTPERRGVIGFWIPTESALMLAWTEMLSGNANTDEANDTIEATETTENAAPAGFETPHPAAPKTNTLLTFEVPTNRAIINVMKGVAPPKVTFPALQIKPGIVRGYVKDSKGNPLQGAVIGVRSSATGGFYSGAQGKTDAKGYYEIAAPWGAAEFYCASYTVDYFDDRAAMGLHPADGEASQFATANGLVENWVMLPYGIADRDRVSEHPEYINNYYGGSLSVGYFVSDPRFGDDGGLPEGSEIDLTLTPEGPLLDGSKGRSFVFNQRVVDGVARGFKIVNLPVGQYRVIAWLKQNGHPSVLRFRETGPKASAPFGMNPKQTSKSKESAVITFRPAGATSGKVPAAHGNWDTLDITLSR